MSKALDDFTNSVIDKIAEVPMTIDTTDHAKPLTFFEQLVRAAREEKARREKEEQNDK